MWIAFYVLAILALNIGFSYVPMIDFGFGMFSPMAILAGAVFVLRDFAQRHHGHWVLIGMGIGAVLSYVLADPYVATASVLAFGIAEAADYMLYTWTKKPFKDRVLVSSLVSTPVDTLVFLFVISGLTGGTFVLMVLSKMLAALVVWYHYRLKGDAVAEDKKRRDDFYRATGIR